MNEDQANALAAAAKHPAFARVHAWLSGAFPGATITAAHTASLISNLRRHDDQGFVDTLEHAVGTKLPDAPIAHESEGSLHELRRGQHTTYQIDATHLRMTPTYSCFTGIVKAARVTLHRHSKLPFFTHYGGIYAHDHIVFTVDEVRAWIAESQPDFMAFERVDLITPAREIFRFAPVALFFGYETHDSPAPSFFIIESGYATGQPAVLYLGETMDPRIVAKTGYKPTPFSSPDNIYTSTLTLQDTDEPDTLVIESRQAADERPYIAITMRYAIEEDRHHRHIIPPATQTIQAAVRVESIKQGLGWELDELGRIFAKFGLDHYEWNLWPVPERTTLG